MILSLDLKNSYGQQNEDIARKNKITKISIPVYSITAQKDSSTENVSYGPITIEDTGNTEEKIISTLIKDDIDVGSNPFKSYYSSKFPSFVGTVKYKKYSVSINLTEYPDLKNLKSMPIYDFDFSGQRQKALSNEKYTFISKKDIDKVPTINYNDLVTKFQETDFVSGLDNLETSGFWGINEWAETNEIKNNIYTDSGDSATSNNAYSEITNFIQTAADETRMIDDDFLRLNSFITPEITNWNNNGTTVTFQISIPQSVYLFGSKTGQKYAPTGTGWVFGYEVYLQIIYNNAEFYKYVFNKLNLKFILNYNVETTDKIYFDGNREYSAANSPLFTENVHLADTKYTTVTHPDGSTEIIYDNYYDYDFSKELVERYKNGKLELEIKYPVEKIKTLNGLDVVYISNYGIATHIGNRYFDQDGNEILTSETDTISEVVQIPEGYICNILNNGNIVYKNSDGSPKYFIVESSNLIYNGIVLNELKLIETTISSVSAFDETSWAEIDALGEIGELQNYFTVGEKKYVKISGQPDMANPVPFVILGFNHDDLSNGNGKAGMTVGMESVLYNEYPFDDTKKTPSSWATSDFRTKYVPTLTNLLPSDLQSIIKKVNKKSIKNDTSSSEYALTEDTLFLLSLTEIVGENYMNHNNFLSKYFGVSEGSQYEYWKTVKNGTVADNRKKLDYVSYNLVDGVMQPVPVDWGVRSLQNTGIASVSYIDKDGEIQGASSTTNNMGISFAFCVGEKSVNQGLTLESATWDKIDYISSAGKASEVFSVGDEKTIKLANLEDVTLVILGFNHDTLSDGTGKAGITFGLKNLLATKYAINSTATNVGGWRDSAIRSSTMNTILASLPSDLQSVIKNVTKKSRAGGNLNAIYNTEDKLWLFSEVEIDGNNDDANYNEGSQYEYWKTVKDGTVPENRAKYLSNGKGAMNDWWLRTPFDSPIRTDSFYYVGGKGESFDFDGEQIVIPDGAIGGTATANTEFGICFGFCI